MRDKDRRRYSLQYLDLNSINQIYQTHQQFQTKQDDEDAILHQKHNHPPLQKNVKPVDPNLSTHLS